MKFCKSCQQIKDHFCFHNDRTAKDGLSYICKDCAISKSRKWFRDNHARAIKQQQEYNENNREKRMAYYFANKERINKNHVKWCLKQRKENPIYRLHDNLTSSIGRSLRTGKNGKRTEEILGYSISALKKRLEKQFTSGMSWVNYGQWHVDHIVPLCAFNITTVGDLDFKRAWALSNLQPLWKHDNLVKNGKVERPFQPALALMARSERR